MIHKIHEFHEINEVNEDINKKIQNKIHQTASIAPEAIIGEGTAIWQNCIIQDDVIIGSNCNIGANVFIEKGVRIGNGVKIKNNVAIYTGVIVEDDAFLGPSCVFTNVVNPRSFIPRKHEFKQTIIKQGATIGANATIICGHNIGKYAMIGAGTVVAHDVKDYALVVGNPDRQIGYVCQCGVRLNKDFTCPTCGKNYAGIAEDYVGIDLENLEIAKKVTPQLVSV